jgi:beta-lactamase regulating signal transducer with metallopeptidase domain
MIEKKGGTEMMTPAYHLLDVVSVATADFLIASIWQALVLVLACVLIVRLLPALSAAVKSLLWTAVLMLALFVPALFQALPHHVGASTSVSSGIWHPSDKWSIALVCIWAALSLLRCFQLFGNAIRLQRLAIRATDVTPVESIAAILRRSRRRLTLCLCSDFDRPIIAGFVHPRILISPDLYAKLSTTELEQVVLHEVEHLRRFDDWTNLLQKVSLALLPLHPVLLWLDRQMCLERELACDDSVLREVHARKSYAACLTRLAEDSLLRRGFSLALGALGSRERTSELSLRVHRILSAPRQTMSPARAWMTSSVLLVGLMGGAIALAHSPQLLSFTAPQDIVPSHQTFASTAIKSVYNPSSVVHPAFIKASFQGNKSFLTVPAVAHVPSTPVKTKSRARNAIRMRSVMRNNDAQRHFYAALAISRMTAVPRALTFTVSHSQDQQVLYAAVPLRDGWLILQL